MIDFIKAISDDQKHINRLHSFAEKYLKPHKPQTNKYICFANDTGRFRFEFRKLIYKGKLVGFHHIEICFNPHYIFNNNHLHNGNDFTPLEAVKTIRQTFLSIGFEEGQFKYLKVVNIEYGLNLDTGLPIENIINGILYTKKKPFVIPVEEWQYFKISDSTKYKIIKAYAKGIQFEDFPEYGIDRNTFRFEVRSKQSKFINKLGIYNVADLLNLKVYNALSQSLINEWENILIIDLRLKNKVNPPEFWEEFLAHKDRNKFRNESKDYYKNIDQKNNLHHLIKCKIIDKITALTNYANSTKETPINKGKSISSKTFANKINLESAYFNINEEAKTRLCKVTNLDISMQKKDSLFLCSTGLNWYKENTPEIFTKLCAKYLSEKMKHQSIEAQFYYIAHNIRNHKTNPDHNLKFSRQRFEQRNYHPNQLQFKWE